MTSSISEFIDCPGACIHVRRWGDRSAPILFMLHDKMDVSASFQFVIEEFSKSWNIIAPDWRGFGKSEKHDRPYSEIECLSDLDFLMNSYSPSNPVSVIGHGMGGYFACFYAALYPNKINKIVSLDGFGSNFLTKYTNNNLFRQWVENRKTKPSTKWFPDRGSLTRHLMRNDKYLTANRAKYLSFYLATDLHVGLTWKADPWHLLPTIPMCGVLETNEIWKTIECPILLLSSEQSTLSKRINKFDAEFSKQKMCLKHFSEIVIEKSTHMLHYDNPALVAELAELFLLDENRAL